MKSEFADLFVKSKAVSTMKGKSHILTIMPKANKDNKKIADFKEKIKESDSKKKSFKQKI